MPEFIVHALHKQGRTLEPDTDHLLAQTLPSQLLLINITPGHYAFEQHNTTEYLLCISGQLAVETENGLKARAEAGDMIEIPPGLKHRFADNADAVIFTIAQISPN